MSDKEEIEQVEVRSIEQEKPQKKKNIFIRFKDSIYQKPAKRENAWKLLTNLTNKQRITFAAGKLKHDLLFDTQSYVAFFGWTLDAFDFFSVSLSATRIAEDFGVQVSDVTSKDQHFYIFFIRLLISILGAITTTLVNYSFFKKKQGFIQWLTLNFRCCVPLVL